MHDDITLVPATPIDGITLLVEYVITATDTNAGENILEVTSIVVKLLVFLETTQEQAGI